MQSLSGNLGVWGGGDGRKKPTWVKVTICPICCWKEKPGSCIHSTDPSLIWVHGSICYLANNNKPGAVSEEGALPQPVKMWQPPAPSTHMQSCDWLDLRPSPILAAALP